MIILEPAQLPKLEQSHKVHVPTHNHENTSFRRPASSLSTSTLPDYEESQKAHISPLAAIRAQRPRFYPLSPFRRSATPPSRSRRCTLFVYYIFLAYAIIGSVVLLPILVWKTRQSSNDTGGDSRPIFFQDPPPSLGIPLYDNSHMNMALMDVGGGTSRCNTWTSGPSSFPNYTASLNFSFPISPSLRVSTDDDANGLLVVNLNSNKSVSDIVFKADVQYSDPDFFHNSSLCYSQTGNLTTLSKHAEDNAFAANLTLLLPRSSHQIEIPEFATYASNFEQRLGALSPSVTFNNVALEGSHEPISFESIVADTLVVKTSDAPVTGNMNVTGALSIDTVSAAIDANISLVNLEDWNHPTSAALDTGNAPLNVNFIVAASGSPKRPQFLLKASTFNAPLNITMSHAPSTPSSRTYVHGIAAAGPLTLSADALFNGVFDLSTKAASAQVQRTLAPGTNSTNFQNGVCEVEFDYKMAARSIGWAGTGKRPSEDDQSHLMLETSLGPVTLNLYNTRGVPGVVSWATTKLWS
ncbi:hypothetical protein K488DRAFT_73387 [Vararia minispora EC-137]|uniref:Uncharacterized protein n=1 Tax=Vararia minispora EC-137 TaxID=1314806 RepID=A0ACB8QBB9_9AGAM|nr:hypothetical protein K488DRAFT_73387 [Vararia minispora EC-137]